MTLDGVILALVGAFTTAAPDATVFDGPRPTAGSLKKYVLVGSTGEDDDAATANPTLSGLGPGTWHDEDGTVTCSAWAWSGGTDLPTVRADALALYEACRDAVYADRTLGGVLDLNGLAEVSEARVRQQHTSEGPICRVLFTVTYRNTNT